MHRILLITVGLLFSFQIGLSQNQSDSTDSLFLGIDPERTFEQYGYDPVNLNSDINPFPLAAFAEETHELSELDFDSEIILFNQQGELDGVVFSKLFSQEEFGTKNVREAASFYKRIQNRLQKVFGSPITEETGFTAWSTSQYGLRLVVNRETSVQLFYNVESSRTGKTTFIEEPFDIEINEKTFTIRSVEDLDAAVVELFNAYLDALNEELVRSFARKNGDTLDIFFEREVDLRPEEKQGEIKKAARVLEETLINNYVEQVLINVFDQQDDLDLLRTIQVTELNFILDMFYGDGSEARLTKSISIKALETLQFPLSRKDARSLLRDM